MIATITIESKKRYKRMVIAFALALSMFVGSAFALSPSYQQVTMPDPYGIMTLSLDDDSTSRTLYTSSYIRYGFSSSSYTTYSSQTLSFSHTNAYYQLGTYSSSSSTSKYYIYIPSGFYADYSASVSYPSSEYQSIVVSGGGKFYFYAGQASAYPNTVQVVVNGSPVGSASSVDSSSGSFTLTDQEIALSSNVSTVGLRFTWSSADSVTATSSYASYGSSLRMYCIDNVVITPVEVSATDYTPWLDRIIAWEQSIFGAIQSLGDSLSSSLGGVGESASRIANVFARDDDIQLRDDVDEAVTEVTDSFFTPVAEGETETEFDSATKIDKQKVTDVKQVAEGATALFDTGYEFTDGFEIIATDDSFLSWFTAETATALDSTGAVATVGDDDPYNMHFYYDHLQEIELWKGD